MVGVVKRNAERIRAFPKEHRSEAAEVAGPRSRETAVAPLFHPHGRELLRLDRTLYSTRKIPTDLCLIGVNPTRFTSQMQDTRHSIMRSHMRKLPMIAVGVLESRTPFDPSMGVKITN
jgi:hypothetical protein